MAPADGQPLLRGLPQRAIDDLQLRCGADDPGFPRVRPGDPLAGRRVLDEVLPVPHPLADIQPVAQQAGLAHRIAEDQRGRPLAAARAGNAGLVEADSNGARRDAARVLAEHPPDELRLLGHDLHLAGGRRAVRPELPQHPIAEAQPAAAGAGAHTALDAAMGLLGEVLEEHRRHRALEADMQFRDIAVGDGD
ncbi:hypothetical protein OL599_24895 [Rhodovastum sp. RN2-1]|uniref:Uncharacterized protein n=1 Tax=Limobrevibacterium gyesilva TaxID=2991712 RepID=A0AA41YYW9_9PROT|nr:hypothetical protein [Limobrevibacterium gyesilva]MCW3477792.1 hypothetical protein [Limobrevibacterium gyesilva]